MPGPLPFFLVDAFSHGPYSGNPAGVVLQADEIDAAGMQAIAREVNASETAFVCGGEGARGPQRIRWFTPTIEVGFCGHATLAAAHALRADPQTAAYTPVQGARRPAAVITGFAADDSGLAGGANSVAAPLADAIAFESAAGTLRLRREPIGGQGVDSLWWLEMPEASLRPDNTNPMKTCELLGLSIDDLDPAIPPMRTRDNDVILIVRAWQRLYDARPRMDELARWSERHGIRGFMLSTTSTLDESTHVASRFFAPAAGVPEDPVTGSVHGPLCALLVQHGRVRVVDGRAALNCVQSQAGGRSGLVRALVETGPATPRVSIAGQCHVTVVGSIATPGG